jgi:hypothetical protein
MEPSGVLSIMTDCIATGDSIKQTPELRCRWVETRACFLPEPDSMRRMRQMLNLLRHASHVVRFLYETVR